MIASLFFCTLTLLFGALVATPSAVMFEAHTGCSHWSSHWGFAHVEGLAHPHPHSSCGHTMKQPVPLGSGSHITSQSGHVSEYVWLPHLTVHTGT